MAHPGSGVFISLYGWKAADAQFTYQSMAVSFVKSVFIKKILLKSYLKGSSSKINKNTPDRDERGRIEIQAIEGIMYPTLCQKKKICYNYTARHDFFF